MNASLLRTVRCGDSSYPQLLQHIHKPPDTLYLRGADVPVQPLLAIVGTRKATAYGSRVLEKIIPSLVEHDVGIVSGLAFGIDAMAHRITLQNGGYTAAVLPGGCNREGIYPSSHTQLSDEILAAGGTLISENPPNTQAQKFCFPLRNRIIAGMTLATLVIEAPEKSGALITAYQALEYNRSVGAVPGSIFGSASQGTNALLRRGAYVITDVHDVLTMLGIEITQTQHALPLSLPAEWETLLSHLSSIPLHLDELIRSAPLPQTEITRMMTAMELAGVVENCGGNRYIRMH